MILYISLFSWCFVLTVAQSRSTGPSDRNCTYHYQVEGKYAPSAINCENVYSDSACTMIYGKSVALDESAERPLLCFMNNGVRNEEMKRIAIRTCPKTCGYCCLTNQYNCKNAKIPRVKCESVTMRQCRDPAWRTILTEDCPNVCGFCAEGGCEDKAVECENDMSICGSIKMQDFVQEYCRRTCGLCRPSTGPGSSNYGSRDLLPNCVDLSTNCASWEVQGLCKSPFYTYDYKFRNCAATCGLC
ncbi:unnamed protein product [Caenorhabditis bovis]|uniref:ShKT domain-containing protein n=1 Tax=Caenorhabditis bovis TaxID=2654633 RepID=A0A8S1ELL5_9PELO|nr:unnamed protein product [Caenorhabditis bovis]